MLAATLSAAAQTAEFGVAAIPAVTPPYLVSQQPSDGQLRKPHTRGHRRETVPKDMHTDTTRIQLC